MATTTDQSRQKFGEERTDILRAPIRVEVVGPDRDTDGAREVITQRQGEISHFIDHQRAVYSLSTNESHRARLELPDLDATYHNVLNRERLTLRPFVEGGVTSLNTALADAQSCLLVLYGGNKTAAILMGSLKDPSKLAVVHKGKVKAEFDRKGRDRFLTAQYMFSRSDGKRGASAVFSPVKVEDHALTIEDKFHATTTRDTTVTVTVSGEPDAEQLRQAADRIANNSAAEFTTFLKSDLDHNIPDDPDFYNNPVIGTTQDSVFTPRNVYKVLKGKLRLDSSFTSGVPFSVLSDGSMTYGAGIVTPYKSLGVESTPPDEAYNFNTPRPARAQGAVSTVSHGGVVAFALEFFGELCPPGFPINFNLDHAKICFLDQLSTTTLSYTTYAYSGQGVGGSQVFVRSPDGGVSRVDFLSLSSPEILRSPDGYSDTLVGGFVGSTSLTLSPQWASFDTMSKPRQLKDIPFPAMGSVSVTMKTITDPASTVHPSTAFIIGGCGALLPPIDSHSDEIVPDDTHSIYVPGTHIISDTVWSTSTSFQIKDNCVGPDYSQLARDHAGGISIDNPANSTILLDKVSGELSFDSIQADKFLVYAFPPPLDGDPWVQTSTRVDSVDIVKVQTPYKTFTPESDEAKNSFHGWLHVSNGDHYIQGFLFDKKRYLYLNKLDFMDDLTQALDGRVTIDDIKTMVMDVPLGVIRSLK